MNKLTLERWIRQTNFMIFKNYSPKQDRRKTIHTIANSYKYLFAGGLLVFMLPQMLNPQAQRPRRQFRIKEERGIGRVWHDYLGIVKVGELTRK